MTEAIAILQKLYGTIVDEHWANGEAKEGVLTGIAMSIDKLKKAQ